MIWSDARRNAAQMIEFGIVRHWAVSLLVHCGVRHFDASVNANSSVSSAVAVVTPNPTFGCEPHVYDVVVVCRDPLPNCVVSMNEAEWLTTNKTSAAIVGDRKFGLLSTAALT